MKTQVKAEVESVRNSMTVLERSAIAALRSDNEVYGSVSPEVDQGCPPFSVM